MRPSGDLGATRDGNRGNRSAKPLDIAIVGLSCRFPGNSDSPEAFWDALEAGQSGVAEILPSRWDVRQYYHPDPAAVGRYYSRRAGMLPDVSGFDAAFFGISPREAEQMDPQQRLLLELTWESFERAGIPPEQVAGKNCAVYVGISATDYGNSRSGDPAGFNAYTLLGSTLSIASNRISHFFDLRGASMSIDTACSSTLVALNEAVHSIQDGRSEMAAVGGVHLLLSPEPFVGFSRATMLSEYGECRAFAKAAKGYVRAEGGGVLLLKPLAKALADGDPIAAVIRGCGTNSDGRTIGIASPSSRQQEILLKNVYEKFGLDAEDLVYLEAHGTGTAAGDPVEAEAIGRALGQRRKSGPLPIGSVKTNIGHLEPASGMAALIKAIGILNRGVIPPSLHAEELNPDIPFGDLNIRVVRSREALPGTERAPLVGVSSFGFGGTNAHVVLAQHRAPVKTRSAGRSPAASIVLPLSARSDAALRKMADRVASMVEEEHAPLEDLAFSAALRRTHYDRRLLVRTSSRKECAQALRRFAEGQSDPSLIHGSSLSPRAKVAFVFAGNGAQGTEEGLRLMMHDPLFQPEAQQIDALVKAACGWSILEQIHLPEKDRSVPSAELVQLLSFGIQATLVNALVAEGLRPDAVTGHSFGEIPAAWAAGALTFAQAVKLILERCTAQEMSRGRGRMAAASIDATRAAREIARYHDEVEIAAVNSPCAVTFTGDSHSLGDLGRRLSGEGVSYRMLELDYPFHSRQLEGARSGFLEGLSHFQPSTARYPFYSTVTGVIEPGEALNADYWWRNMRQCVRFDQSMNALIADGHALFIEIGAHPIMQAYIRHSLRALNAPGQPLCVIARQAPHGAARRVSDVVAKTYTLGASLDWRHKFPRGGKPVSLPTYPWDREHYWYPSTDEARGRPYQSSEGTFLGGRLDGGLTAWENLIDTDVYPFLADHVVGGNVFFPASGFLEIALEAAEACLGEGPKEIELLQIHRPMSLEAGKSKRIRVRLSEDENLLRVESKARLSGDAWTLHATARIARANHARIQPLGALSKAAGGEIAVAACEHYQAAEAIGLHYGPAFRVVESVTVQGRLAEATLGISDGATCFELHPAILDGALQTLIAVARDEPGIDDQAAFVPCQLERAIIFKRRAKIVGCRVALSKSSPRSLLADFDLLDGDGAIVASLRGFRFQRAELNHLKAKSSRFHATTFIPLEMEGAAPALPTAASLIQLISERREGPIDLNAIVAPMAAAPVGTSGWKDALGSNPGFLTELLLAGTGRATLRAQGSARLCERREILLNNAGSSRALDDILQHALRLLAEKSSPARKLRLLEIAANENKNPLELVPDRFAHCRWIPPQECPAGTGTPARLADDERLRDRTFDIVLLRHPAWLGFNVPDLLAQATRLLAPGGRLLLVSYRPGPWLNLAVGGNSVPELSAWKSLLEGARFMQVETLPVAAGLVAVAEAPVPGIELPSGRDMGRRKWLIALGNSPVEDHLAHDLAIHLVGAGHAISFLRDRTSWHADNLEIGFPFEDPTAWQRALTQSASSDPLGVIYLKGCSIRDGNTAAIEEQTWPLACLAKALATSPNLTPPEIVLVTAGAQSPPPEMAVEAASDAPHQAAIWGFARVLRNENPNLKCRTIDLHASGDGLAGLGESLAEEVLADATEDEVIRGADRRLGMRLRAAAPPAETVRPTECLRLEAGADGLAGLNWQPALRPMPGDGEIQIEVKATGLNFRDVMYSMGVLPDEALENGLAGATLGMEGAGLVTALGTGAQKFSVGDRVFFFGPACFATHVVTSVNAAAVMSPHLDFHAAATIPTAFFTVTYALSHLARLLPNERILIHGAAGGVGLAAIQYAQHIGADVFATVGSAEKRQLLQLIGLPENRIFDSRSLSFADDVLAATGGQGVDVVLNSLAGEAIQKGLAVLRPFGRFVELGKRDFYANSRVGLRPFRNNLTYFGIDADQLLKVQPAVSAQILSDMAALFSSGKFRPLPYHIFGADKVVEAFRQMQQGRHMGKLVVVPPPLPAPRLKAKEGPATLDANACYLITGGSSGFGLATAETLARLGARHLVLVGRHAKMSEALQETTNLLESRGVKVEYKACDVSDPALLRTLFTQINDSGHPLRGVVHAAAIYDDFPIVSMTREGFRTVLATKAGAALELRAIFAEQPLDFLVYYSSVTVALGNPGQAGYVAANAVLDALALADARRHGPSVSLAWGAIGDVGHLARRTDLRTAFEERLGVKMISSENALADLPPYLLSRSSAGQMVIAELDWSAPALRVACGLTRHSRFRDLITATCTESGESTDIRSLMASLSRDEFLALAMDLLAEQIGEVLRIPPEKLDRQRPITDVGMDSLTAIELRILIEKKFGFDLPAMMISEGVTIARLAERICDFLVSAPAEKPVDNRLTDLYAKHGELGDGFEIPDRIEVDRHVGQTTS